MSQTSRLRARNKFAAAVAEVNGLQRAGPGVVAEVNGLQRAGPGAVAMVNGLQRAGPGATAALQAPVAASASDPRQKGGPKLSAYVVGTYTEVHT